jgi:hypothetical protein
MAFNIRSRAGWHRLWLVGMLVWGAYALIETVDHIPSEERIDASLQSKLAGLTPEAIARENESIKKLGQVMGQREREWRKELVTSADVVRREEAARRNHKQSLSSLSADRTEVIGKGFAMWLIPSFLVYLAGCLPGSSGVSP